MEIAVVGAAASVVLGTDGTIASIAVALNAVAPSIVSVAGLDDLVGFDTVGVMAGRAVAVAARRAAGEVIESPVNRSEGIGAPH